MSSCSGSARPLYPNLSEEDQQQLPIRQAANEDRPCGASPTNTRTMPSADHHPEDEVSRRRRRLAIAVLLFFNLTAYSGVIGVFSPRLREYFSLTYEQWGTMSGLGSLGQTVSLLLVGFVIARFGVRRITELSLGGVGACFLLIGQGASLLALRVSLFFSGTVLGGFSRSSLPAYLVALYPSHKRRMISLQLTCGSVMGIVDSAVGQPASELVSGGGPPGIGQVVLLALSGRRVPGPLLPGPC